MITRHNQLERFATPYFQPRLPGATGDVTAALIGPMGGTIRVTDPGSALFGTALRIPAGALEAHTLIQIEQGGHPCPFGLSPSVKITPDGLSFNHPAEIDMRIDRSSVMAEEVSPSFYVYDESDTEWVAKEGRMLDSERGVFRCTIWHL
ncbi:MAG: hypothetical protein V2B19_33225 [Pseudomonadota bacterium]